MLQYVVPRSPPLAYFLCEAETISIINALISRVNRLETDMIEIKRSQTDQDSQIDVLALEVRDFRTEFADFKDEMSLFRQEFNTFRDEVIGFRTKTEHEFEKVHQQIRSLHTRMDNGFGEIKDELKLLRQALQA